MSEAPSKREQIEAFKKKFGFIEPNRGNLDDETIEWRKGKPNYDIANLEYFKGKSMNHAKGSLEKVVEDLVKTWEMEMSHKKDFKQFTTVQHEKFELSANGEKMSKGEEAKENGNYIALMQGTRKELFDASKHTWQSSHDVFRGTFTNGFPWEVVTVFSGPPKVVFSWRHWAIFDGQYKGRKGDGETYEMYGMCSAEVDENLKISKLEIFYRPNEWLEAVEFGTNEEYRKGVCPILGNGKSIVPTDVTEKIAGLKL